MTKTYVTSGGLTMKVYLGNKRNKLIEFNTSINGMSAFITDDEEVQKALDNDPKYGNFYSLLKVDDEGNTVQEKEAIVDDTPKEYFVNTLQEARNILIEKYSVNNTTIRSKAAVLEAAEKLGITFKGL